MTSDPSIFHEGELEVQARAGESAPAIQNSRMIRRQLSGGALQFLREQPMAILAARDDSGRVWVSAAFGKPGFLSSEDGRVVWLDVSQACVPAADLFWTSPGAHRPVGVLLIDLSTRRRFRINGNLATEAGGRLRLEVVEAFPNCSKYIQRRQLVSPPCPQGSWGKPAALTGELLRTDHRRLIEEAETVFLGTAHLSRGVDVSHRGGSRGFISVYGERTLRMPDYPGNSMFNSFGNLSVNPRAGLLVFDFAGARLLQLTGSAQVLWNQADPGNLTGGTGRFLDFSIERWVEHRLAHLPFADLP